LLMPALTALLLTITESHAWDPTSAAIIVSAAAAAVLAGGLLNLMRVFGTSVGVASASAVLSWWLGVLTGWVTASWPHRKRPCSPP
jgi:hypothetical protein